MVDFRIADTAPEHPKLRAAGLAPFGLWAAAGAYAMRELTDGWVPEYWVQTWPSGKKHATALVTVGLWSREPRNGLPGFRFHDWGDYQRTAASVQRERAEARDRSRRNRESKRSSGERSGERIANVRRTVDNSHEPSKSGHETVSDPSLLGSRSGRTTVATRHVGGPPEQPVPAETPNEVLGVRPNVRSASHDSLSLTRALTPEGSGREGTSGNERADSRNAPRPRCPEHAQLPPDQRVPDCGACKQLRLNAEQHAADQAKQAAADRAARRAAIDACPLCDDAGLAELDTGALTRCTHPTRLEVVS